MDSSVISNLFIVYMICLVLFFTGVIVWYRESEKKSWNKGYCKVCKTKWIKFDTDSGGSRGYRCKCIRDSLWISYSIDKIRKV